MQADCRNRLLRRSNSGAIELPQGNRHLALSRGTIGIRTGRRWQIGVQSGDKQQLGQLVRVICCVKRCLLTARLTLSCYLSSTCKAKQASCARSRRYRAGAACFVCLDIGRRVISFWHRHHYKWFVAEYERNIKIDERPCCDCDRRVERLASHAPTEPTTICCHRPVCDAPNSNTIRPPGCSTTSRCSSVSPTIFRQQERTFPVHRCHATRCGRPCRPYANAPSSLPVSRALD